MHHLLPTGRGWLVLVIHLLCLAMAFINQTIFTLVIACICLATLIASFFCALFSLHGIEMRRAPASDAQVGCSLELPLVIRNCRSRRRQQMVVFEQLPFTAEGWHKQIVPGLASRQEYRLRRTTHAARRGLFRLSRVILRSGDPAGLFRREKYFDLPEELLVLPAIRPLPELHFEETASSAVTADHSINRVGASQEFYGIREYRTTDGIRFINWRATARHRKLMVNEFERNAHAAVALLLDLPKDFAGSGDHSNLEYLVTTAASLIAQFAERFCTLGFAAGGDQPRLVLPDEATTLRQRLMRELALLQPGDIPLATALEELLPRLLPHTLVICLSLSENKDLAVTLTGLAQASMEVRWSCAAPQDFPGILSRIARQTAKHPTQIPPGLVAPLRLQEGGTWDVGRGTA
ncbi:MAG: DUF58 domain-containing protein [Victivallales bacterium]|nr:DUF58 domain-containing protein [Victivallales bacterium]